MVNIYSVRDQFTGYGQLFTADNDAVALRDFRLAVSRKDTLLYASAKDFDLMKVGSFDPELGCVVGDAPVIVASGASVVKEFADD